MIRSLVLVCMICFVWRIDAQVYLSNFLKSDNSWESSANPSFVITDKRDSSSCRLEFFDVSVSGASNSIALDQLLVNNGGGQYGLNKSGILNNLSRINKFRAAANVSTINIAWQRNEWLFSFGHAIRMNNSLSFSEDLVRGFIEGNAGFIGRAMDLTTNINSSSYTQYAFGIGYGNDRLRLGIRTKMLLGIQDVSTASGQIFLNTSADIFQLNLDTKYLLNTSGILDYQGIRDISVDFDSYDENLFWSENRSFAFDIGLSYAINDRLNVDVALFDFGSTRWRTNVSNYSSDDSSSFEGINLVDYLRDELDAAFTDSIESLLDLEETNLSYSSDLPTHIQVGARYQIDTKTSSNIRFKYLDYANDGFISIGANIGRVINKNVELTSSMVYSQENPLSLGLLGRFRFGPVEILCAYENLLVFINKRYARARMGIALEL